MHKVSRTLLLAGVLAFGTLTAACGDKVTVAPSTNTVGVQSVLVSPPSASVAVGQSITIAASVTADATTAKTVTWTSSTPAVATVDATGKVTGVSVGTATITATATADASKQSASAITVTASSGTNVPPAVAIGSVTDNAGAPVNLANVQGQINVTLNETGGAGNIEVFLAPVANCTTNTIAANDVVVASQATTATQAGVVTLSFNTAQLTAANAARFINGGYCVKARLTTAAGTAIATNTIPITLANVSFYKATLAFASVTGGPTSAVSTLNGLNYNQGTLTATITPVNFNSGSPVALISGQLNLSGEQGGAGAGPTVNPITFTNIPVTSGVATIVFTDTANTIVGTYTGVRSIAQYTSAPGGDNLFVNSATDAAGNPVTATALVASGIRIDNEMPALATSYTVTAPNGYIGAAYSFASGTVGTALDTHGTTGANLSGVGGVTTTYYVGAAGSAAFASATSCSITGLTAAAVGTDLANTNAINVDQAKVVVKDALGNQTCQTVGVTTVTGNPVSFGVDKIAPVVFVVGPTPAGAPAGFSNNNGASANTGYAVAKNFSFVWQDTISQFINGVVTTPLKGTLTKNFFTPGSSATTDCVIGTYAATPKTCSAVSIATTAFTTAPGNVAPWNVNSFDFTNGTNAIAYYQFNGFVTDLAGNVSAPVARLAAFDNFVPTVAALTQSPAPAVALGAVTVTGTAVDALDLTSSKGRLQYATATNSIPFQSVNGTSFGPNFDVSTVTTAPASVTLTNIYRGMQSVDVGGTIQAGGVVPTATITVTNVGTLSGTSPVYTITTSTTKADILLNTNTFTGASTAPAPATTQATTTIAVTVGGLVADAAFQNQPFAQVDLYKCSVNNSATCTNGELVSVGTNTTPVGQDQGANRSYTYTLSGISLTAGVTNWFFAVGRNAAGDAVISNGIPVANP
jgi:hypothetical protein